MDISASHRQRPSRVVARRKSSDIFVQQVDLIKTQIGVQISQRNSPDSPKKIPKGYDLSEPLKLRTQELEYEAVQF